MATGDAASRAEILPGPLGGEPLAAARRCRACGGVVLVDPGAAVVAVNADRRQIDDRAQMSRARSKASPKARKHRIAVLVWRNRDQRRSRPRRWRAVSSGVGDMPSNDKRLQPSAAKRVQAPPRVRRRAPCRRCARSRRRTRRRNVPPNSRARSKATWTSDPQSARAAAHSATTSGSDSAARDLRAQCVKPRAIEPAERPHGGAADQRRRDRRATARLRRRGVASPELPIAISTLRIKRARPMRLTAVLANNARKPASSSRASSASRGARNASRAASFASRPACGEFVPRTDRQAIVAAIDAIAHERRANRAGSGPCARW